MKIISVFLRGRRQTNEMNRFSSQWVTEEEPRREVFEVSLFFLDVFGLVFGAYNRRLAVKLGQWGLVL